jgi:predicted DsbA family dithiol-disulfide isomerase
VRSHRALLGAEFARAEGKFDAYNEAVYRAYWEEREDISEPAVLERLAANAGLDPAAFLVAVNAERFAENIVPFDDEAYAMGIRHVPTFLFGAEEKLAEANYADLAHAADRFLVRAKKFQEAAK